MYTTISLSPGPFLFFFRIWKETFETYWATRSANTGFTVLFLFPVSKERLNFSELFPTPSPLGWPVLLLCQTPQVLVSENSNLRCVFQVVCSRYVALPGHLKAVLWKSIGKCRLGNIKKPLRFVTSDVLCKLMMGAGGIREYVIHLRQCEVLSLSHLNLGTGFIPVTWFISFGENKLRRWCGVLCT